MCTFNALLEIVEQSPPIVLNTAPRVYRCEADWKWQPPASPDCILWCVLAGHGEIRLEGLVHPLAAGACFVLSPGSKPEASHDPSRPLTVFGARFTLSASPSSSFRALLVKVRDLSLLSSMAERCERANASEAVVGGHVRRVIVQTMLHLLLAEAAESGSKGLDFEIEELRAAILDNPGLCWRVSEMAGQACLSQSQLTRRFARATGRSPSNFVAEVRLERAAKLLVETALPIGIIASSLGYADPHYFSRQFRQHHGTSPTQYRDAGM